jgi:LacI family kdg operon repressor
VDGIIAFPTGGNTDLYEGMIQENYPLIFVDRLIDGLQVDAFLLDNKAASKLAVQHFAQMGHKHIGIITTSLIRNVTPRVERIEGFKEALLEHSLPFNNEYAKGFNFNEIQNGFARMLSLANPPTAFLAGNDLVLMEILKFTKSKGIKIPDDFSLIGIDDVSFANIYHPPLTTIAQPAFEIGKEAAELLIKKIKSKKSPVAKTHRFEPKLIIRDSVKNLKKT